MGPINQNVFRRKKPSGKRSGGRKKAMTQASIDRRSSSVSSPRSKNKKKLSMDAIEQEIDRAYIDTKKKLSHKDLEPDEDIDSLFALEDDADAMDYVKQTSANHFVQSYTNHSFANNISNIYGNKPRDDSYLSLNKNIHRKQQSRDDFAVANRQRRGNNNHNGNFYQNNSHSSQQSHRHTLPPKNYQNTFHRNNSAKSANNQFGQRLYSNSNSNSNHRNHSQQLSSKSPRSLSYGNALQSNPKPFIPPQPPQPIVHSLLMPSERKKLAKKQKKKTDKKKAHKIKQSVGAFFHSFKSKKNPKYSKEELRKIAAEKEEYRAKHREDDDDYFGYYGDPQNNMNASPIPMPSNRMNANPLSQQYKNRNLKEMEILFEDETMVCVTPDTNMDSVNLIALALEKRGWSSMMKNMFNLCIKGDTPASDKEIHATLEDNAKISSFPNLINHLKLSNAKFVITSKQNNNY